MVCTGTETALIGDILRKQEIILAKHNINNIKIALVEHNFI